ncbi:hypothetical protein AeMF1_008317, partial [Aphanomyces euteiches]
MSVLLVGFAMTANVEISLPAPSQVPQQLIFIYGTTSAAAILCMLCCMLMCTMLLLALTQCVKVQHPPIELRRPSTRPSVASTASS